jgi:hypothetical protein
MAHSPFVFSIALSLHSQTDSTMFTRKQELEAYMTKRYNLQIRDDSRLVWAYITKKTEKKMNEVAQELWYMKILYEYTNYEEYCRVTLPRIQYQLMKGHEWHPNAEFCARKHIYNFVIPKIQVNFFIQLME